MTSSGVDTEAPADTDSGGGFWDDQQGSASRWAFEEGQDEEGFPLVLAFVNRVDLNVLIPPVCPVADV